MAGATTTTRYISVPASTIKVDQVLQLNSNATSLQANINKDLMNTLSPGVPVKFADQFFSFLIKDQISRLLNIPQIKQLKYSEENAARTLTFEITEIVKRIVANHIKDNYKVVIQVLTYPKQNEDNILIMSRCLWNYRTDDVLSVEIETDVFKFLIVIHGVLA
ncbi:unnamed protein product [Adineta ricciae]|uniref:Uncharacterized protein n=1 Tax=Adineta ricciae TaxID=249248 RepID=A0A814M4I9_ADIRI|nr:unnamed protein product [Adineta ricciae]